MRSRLISTTSASPRRSIAIRVVSSGTALNTTVLYFGVPRRQWDGTASSLTWRSEEHTSELQSRLHLVCRLLLEKKKNAEQRLAAADLTGNRIAPWADQRSRGFEVAGT